MRLFGSKIDPHIRDLISTALGTERWRALAIGRSADSWLVGTPSALVVVEDDEAKVTPWHEFWRADWDSAADTLSWNTADGSFAATLVSPGRLPEVVQERVEATILVTRSVPVFGGTVVLAVRRPIDDRDGPAFVDLVPGPGVVLNDPRVSIVIERERLAVASEFHIWPTCGTVS